MSNWAQLERVLLTLRANVEMSMKSLYPSLRANPGPLCLSVIRLHQSPFLKPYKSWTGHQFKKRFIYFFARPPFNLVNVSHALLAVAVLADFHENQIGKHVIHPWFARGRDSAAARNICYELVFYLNKVCGYVFSITETLTVLFTSTVFFNS